MNNYYTYLHCKPDGTPFYVGKGSRRRSHDLYARRNVFHRNIINKYGKDNILIYIFSCESEDQAFKDEIQQIAQLKKDGYKLVNMTDGGEGISGHKFTDETKHKISLSHKGQKTFLGRKHTQETKDKISKANKGKKRTSEVIAKIAKLSLGRRMSEENRLKLIMLHTGRKRSAETCKKISDAKKKRDAAKIATEMEY